MISVEISKPARADAIASLQRYFAENMAEPLGDLPAGLLLNFFLEEVGPVIYNQAIRDAQRGCSNELPILMANSMLTHFSIGPRSTQSARLAAKKSSWADSLTPRLSPAPRHL
jgi:uncharacterized protein (DUF2164 family)